MIWKRLKKSTPEQEEEFSKMLEEEKVTWKDKLAMVLSAYLVILLPCAAILIVFGLLLILLVSGLP